MRQQKIVKPWIFPLRVIALTREWGSDSVKAGEGLCTPGAENDRK